MIAEERADVGGQVARLARARPGRTGPPVSTTARTIRPSSVRRRAGGRGMPAVSRTWRLTVVGRGAVAVVVVVVVPGRGGRRGRGVGRRRRPAAARVLGHQVVPRTGGLPPGVGSSWPACRASGRWRDSTWAVVTPVARRRSGWNHSSPPGPALEDGELVASQADEIPARAYHADPRRGARPSSTRNRTTKPTTRTVMSRVVRRTVRRRRPRRRTSGSAARPRPRDADRQGRQLVGRPGVFVRMSSASTTSTTTTVMLSLPPGCLASSTSSRAASCGSARRRSIEAIWSSRQLPEQAVAAQQEAVARARRRG